MRGRPRVTLAILVRDQEQTLGHAIASAQAIADEIVVRDTGSSDASPEIARSMGARVLCGTWHESFAEARNLLLDSCRTEWILALDADEHLAAGGDQLERLITTPGATAYRLDIDSPIGFGRVETTHAVRLFRRTPRRRYRYRVHELLMGVGRAMPSPLRIRHTGYTPSLRLSKCMRNLALLHADLAERPGDPYLQWHRGRELELLRRDDQSLAAWEAMASALEQVDVVELRQLRWSPAALGDWASALGPHGELARAVPLAARVVQAHPLRPLARWIHAQALAASGRATAALSAARRLLEPRPWRFDLPGEDEVLTRHAPALIDRLLDRPSAALSVP